jgi:hypothetical protein
MPTDVKFKRRPTRIVAAITALLVLGRWFLIVVATSLAIVLFLKVQIVSWQAGDIDQGISAELAWTPTSP